MPLLLIFLQLGAVDMFSDKANLEEMLPVNTKTAISSVIHKAKIIVNEKGTIASGASGQYSNSTIIVCIISIKSTKFLKGLPRS